MTTQNCIQVEKVQKIITFVWMLFFTLLFFRCVLLTLSCNAESSVCETRTDLIWDWFSIAILPATGLIVGLHISVAWNTNSESFTLRKISAYLAEGFVFLYILVIVLPIVIFEFIAGDSPFIQLEQSQEWLIYIQTPMIALLGKVFSEKTRSSEGCDK